MSSSWCFAVIYHLKSSTNILNQFDVYTDEDAWVQLSRALKNYLLSYHPSFGDMKEDADPYLLKLRAQGQIDKFPELRKQSFFDVPRNNRPST